MGIRMYQEVGLKPEARKFLHENCKMLPDLVCPDCGKVISTKLDCEIYEHEDSFYDDGPNLKKYNLKDGTVAFEVVQAEPWSSGPVSFFYLEIGGKRRFTWTEAEMREYL